MILADTPNAIWYLMRGSGIVSVTMLTLVSVLGIATALNWSPRSIPRFAIQAIHRSLSLAALIFLAIHITTAVLDSFVPISIKDVLIPFTSKYEPLYLGLGTLVLDMVLVLVITSLLRDHIKVSIWRAIHWIAYACLPIALLHALLIGSDASRLWLEVLYGAEFAVALGVASIRVFGNGSASHQDRFQHAARRRVG